MNRFYLSTLATVGLFVLATAPGFAATPVNLNANLSQPLSSAGQFLVRHPYTDVKERGVRVQAPNYTIRQLRDLQLSLRERDTYQPGTPIVSK